MKKLTIGITMLSLAAVLAACGGGGTQQTQPNSAAEPAKPAADTANPTAGGSASTADAEVKYKQSCAGCHGVNLAGGAGPSLQKIGTKYNQEQITGIITKGKGGMPGGLLKGSDADAVAAWLAEKK